MSTGNGVQVPSGNKCLGGRKTDCAMAFGAVGSGRHWNFAAESARGSIPGLHGRGPPPEGGLAQESLTCLRSVRPHISNHPQHLLTMTARSGRTTPASTLAKNSKNSRPSTDEAAFARGRPCRRTRGCSAAAEFILLREKTCRAYVSRHARSTSPVNLFDILGTIYSPPTRRSGDKCAFGRSFPSRQMRIWKHPSARGSNPRATRKRPPPQGGSFARSGSPGGATT